MNRRLLYLNFLGVLALAVLCVLQWRQDSHLNLDLNHADQVCLDQSTVLNDQTNQLQGLHADLDQFKTSLMAEQKQLALTETRLHAAENTNDLLSAECDQLKVAVTNWMDAVKLRDQRITEANHRIESLSADLNNAIQKFNTLVTNYNSVVTNYNSVAQELKAATAPAPAH
jgi:chromosome segregation ATPase